MAKETQKPRRKFRFRSTAGRSQTQRRVRASIIRDRCDLSILPPAPEAAPLSALLDMIGEQEAIELQNQ